MRMLALIAIVGAFACGDSGTQPMPPGALKVVPVATGLSSPLFLTSSGGLDERLFVVEQTGTIRVIKNGQLLTAPYLNVTSKITCCNERGLLGLAFHPQFATNGFFYVNYTDLSGNTKIERYHATPSADVAESGSASPVLGFAQPFANHNGGMLLFGPDNMLWIGTGDGGSGGDPQGNGQKLTTLLGKMLRIDVDGASPYAIPSNNPFAGQAGNRGEIWGLGLRNPWRYAFDRVEGLLYIADVGQNAWEEVHVVPATTAGVNYGWNTMEGMHCYNATTCNQSGLNIPVIEYSHSDGRCSITGGFVYRGNALPGLRGHYFYSDYCVGFLRSFRYSNGAATETREWSIGDVGQVLSFGQDSQGELYILSANGTVYRLSP
ncbi:MAG TPA: PQQ-dependent sugar dehydrogenase [Gemmatimonadaceae bacterium]|nr:PQQ-dependent sugar dehydrogenase [Gemmatimonadaceae bacterium]